MRDEYKKRISRIHKKIVVCVGRLYRNVSYLGACAITGQPPMVLDIKGRAILTATRKRWESSWGPFHRPPMDTDIPSHLDAEIKRVWQQWWDECPSGRWTYKLIPKVSYEGMEVDFHTLQALSGHGVFRDFFHRMHRVPSDKCECVLPETAEHVVMECSLHEDRRPAQVNVKEEASLQSSALPSRNFGRRRW